MADGLSALAVITADDVVRAGACQGGVLRWLLERPGLPVAVPVPVALRAAHRGDRIYIKAAANLTGGVAYGFSYSDGDGFGTSRPPGDGDGDGDGVGDGFGDGYGDGYGFGFGTGGYGDGYGGGYCYGYGDGDGDGYSDGDGDGDGFSYGDDDESENVEDLLAPSEVF